ncbi:MAG TPA: glycosyltransferase [Pirellulales bacterium]|nr:glycosyltransferase [Pirellulales bacterium]
MIAAPRKKIVLLGMMSRMPVAGVVWQTLHYLLGLQRLGYEVYYVETHGTTPRNFFGDPRDNGWQKAAAFIDKVLRRYDLGHNWAFRARFDREQSFGLSDSELDGLYRSADFIINLHGGTEPLPEHHATGRLVFLETDPVELQIQLHDRCQAATDYLAPHCAFFTFGENYGNADCGLPVSERFRFQPTRQPVLCDLWQHNGNGHADTLTTIGNWRQPHRQVSFRGEVYHWSKHYEFLKFIDLPARTGQPFELALSSGSLNADDASLLQSKGWRVTDALSFSDDLEAYRHYITSSRGEFTVAKDQNIRLRSGWFSDRSATYLAAGRPVITQETGFSNILPIGRGLFAFSTLDEAADAVEQIDADYELHSRAAREIAQEYFAAEGVLRDLLERVG